MNTEPKLKIAFVYGPWTLGGRLIDVPNLWISPRGLTGSELSCFKYALEMSRRGHDISLFVEGASEILFDGVKIRPFNQLHTVDNSWDAVYSWNEPEVLKLVPSTILRMVNQQVNDFDYCLPGFDNFVDIYTSPSDSHREYIKNSTGSPDKWHVIPNGCDPSQYTDGPKDRSSVIWASSPDRGLHLLLQMWPKIRKAVPDASLKIYYNMDTWLQRFTGSSHSHPDFREFSYRANYISMSLDRMKNMGIEKFGSTSRQKMAEEMSKAMVLAYPCDTIRFTEGFSVTTMEACAAGLVPIISDVDSLGQIYGGHIPTVKFPVTDRMDQFSDLVIKALTDSSFREEVTSRARTLAHDHRWSFLAEKLESLIRSKAKK